MYFTFLLNNYIQLQIYIKWSCYNYKCYKYFFLNALVCFLLVLFLYAAIVLIHLVIWYDLLIYYIFSLWLSVSWKKNVSLCSDQCAAIHVQNLMYFFQTPWSQNLVTGWA